MAMIDRFSLRDDITAAIREHGDPSMPNYARDYHPGPNGAGGAHHAHGVLTKADEFADLGGRADWVSSDGVRRKAFDEVQEMALSDPALEDDLGFEFTSAAIGYGWDADGPGVGSNFAPKSRLIMATLGPDIAGAMAVDRWEYKGEDYLFVPIMGSTGIVDGTGSAMVRHLIMRAAGSGAGIGLNPIAPAMPFWESMGMHRMPSPFGVDADHELWGMTPAEVRSAAQVLRAPGGSFARRVVP